MKTDTQNRQKPSFISDSVDSNPFNSSVDSLVQTTSDILANSKDLIKLEATNGYSEPQIVFNSIETQSVVAYDMVSPLPFQGTVNTLADWSFSTAAVTLNNAQLNSLYSSAVTDNSYSYQEMLNLLDTAAVSGITASEWEDLKTVYTNSQTIFASDYLKSISYDVIYGNPANTSWWGGAKNIADVDPLGNLSATTSQQNAERLIDKWFLGLDLPMPIAGGDTATGKASTSIFDYSLATGPLFVNGAVASDVNQGATGDCYVMASLGSIANANASLISNSFIDNGNGTYGVKFYLNGTTTYTTVNKSLPVTPYGTEAFGGNITKSLNGELWVSLFEKAYVQLNTQADIDNKGNNWKGENSYQAVEGGWANPIKQITNLNYKYYSSYYSGVPDAFDSGESVSTNPQTYKQTIISALNAGSIGWIGSFGATTGSNGKTDFVSGHAFMLLGYNAATDKFIVRNPWGGDGSGSYNPQFEAPITEFWNSSVKAVVALSDPATADPVFSYTITSNAGTTGSAVTEGSVVTFTITRSGSGAASTVYLSTAPGSAATSDYQSLTKSALNFAAYETSKTVTVSTNIDTLTEGNENFSLNLYKQATDTTSAATATGYIKDATVQNYTYTIASSAGTAGNAVAEGGKVTFTITRDSSGSASTVYLSTAAGSAGASDFQGLDKSALNFAAYETSKVVTVSTYLDGATEGNEYFSLDLYKNIGDATKTATSVGYIKDQSLPSYNYVITSSAGNPSSAVIEGNKVTFTITRSGVGTVSTVYVATADGSAGAADYVGITDKAITFAANEKVTTLDVQTNEDWWLESSEFFILNLKKNLTDAIPSSFGSGFIKDNPVSTYNYTITSNASSSAPLAEGSAVTFTITRSGSGTASTVYLSTADGSAGSSDYQGLDKFALDFAAYETSKTVTVNTYTDSLTEGNEYFWLNLYRNYADSSYTTYTSAYIKDAVVNTNYSYTITSNATSSAPVSEGGVVTFTITRNSSGTASTVYLSTSDGSANASDYQGLDKFALTFAAYETVKTVTVNTNTDGLTEGNEYFWLDLYKNNADTTYATYSSAYIKDAALANYSYTVSSTAGSLATAVAEGGSISFTITRSGSGSASTVYLSTEAGTASAGAGDYAGIEITALNFAANETTKTVTVNTYTDALTEGNEYFWLNVYKSYADAVDWNYTSYGTGYIKDAALANYSYTVTSNAGSLATAVTEGGAVTFTITRSGSGSASTVYLSTQAGTASAGAGDYAGLDITALNFAASETTKTVTVNTYTDSLTEGNEYFWLNVYESYADAIDWKYASYGTGYIKDAALANYSYSVTSSAGSLATAVAEGGTVTFTITRSGSGSASTVYLGTQDGTTSASAGDYAELGITTLNFAANEITKTVTVNTYTDSLTEGSEYFWLNVYKSYADAVNWNYSSYGAGYIKDAAPTNYNYTVTSDARSLATAVTEGGSISFTITRSGSGSVSTVYLITDYGTADVSDYDSAYDTYFGSGKYALTFAANETTKTVTIDTYTDYWFEDTEYFFLELYKNSTDASWTTYDIAYIKDQFGAVPGSSPGAVQSTQQSPNPIGEFILTSSPPTTPVDQSFPGHSLGQFRNDFAFAALKLDGSVLTWGYGPNGGDSSSVSSQLNGAIDVTRIYSTDSAFAAVRADGSVVTWGNANAGGSSSAVATGLNGTVDVTKIYSTANAFAALRVDGSVVTWGYAGNGGDSSAVASQLNGSNDVKEIYSTMSSFAALRIDGSVVTWGYGPFGGDSAAVATQLNGGIDVKKIYATGSAFAALRVDGSVVTWGNALDGGNSASVATKLNGSIAASSVYATTSAFAALRTDGSLVTWGDANSGGDSGAVALKINGDVDVIQVLSTSSAFAALRADGSVVTWGDSNAGGNSLAVASKLNGNIDVVQLYANDAAFAALRTDGSVVTWGYGAYGGDSSEVASQLTGSIPIQQIIANDHAFAALRADGSVVAWGGFLEGGDTSSVKQKLDGAIDVKQLFSTSAAFAALRADGSIVTWGNINYGGDSSAVNSQLTSVVNIANHTTINAAPTLTSFASAVASGNEDSPIPVTFNNLITKGNEADIDGTITAFVVKAVSTGTLKIGTSLATATAWNASTNNIVDASHNAYWTPAANANGSLNAFKVVARDNDGSDSTTPVQATISVTAVNDAPSGTNTTVTTASGSVYTFAAANFGFTDAGDTPSNSLLAVKITTLPTAGALKLNGVAVLAGAFISAADIAAGKLKFTPTTLPDGSNSASFTFQVQDNGGTANGGSNLDATANTLTAMSGKTLNGTPGNDTLTGSAANDVLNGLAGNDILNGGGGADTMAGGDGRDAYYVDNTGDVVTETNAVPATGGTDIVYSYLASYTLGANVENLYLRAPGAANGTGNALNNLIYAGAGNNVLDGAAGTDTVSYYYATAAVTASLAVATAQATGGSGSDKLLNFENLTGSGHNDTLAGNAGANVINGGAGADTMTGGDGSDIYYVDNFGDIVTETNGVLATGGTDTVYSYISSYTLGTNLLGTNLENLRLLATGAANGTGNELANVIYAGAGNNVMDGWAGVDTASYAYATAAVTASLAVTTAQATGGSGSDTLLNFENLTGSNYNDTLVGNASANALNGGVGADNMTGGDGSDIYYVDNAGDKVTETNAVLATGGTDTVYSYLSTYTLGANVENLRILAAGAADGTGNTLNNLIYAGVGDNVLNGDAGSDTVSYSYATAGITVSLATTLSQATGGSGSDKLLNFENLNGSSYNDTLTGNSGNNVLFGSLGKDSLTGGLGADSFKYNSAAETDITAALRDIIQDFSSAQGDKINLSGIDANSAIAGDQAFGSLAQGGTFSGSFASQGDLYFDQTAHILYGNNDADAAADFSIQLVGVNSLSLADFVA